MSKESSTRNPPYQHPQNHEYLSHEKRNKAGSRYVTPVSGCTRHLIRQLINADIGANAGIWHKKRFRYMQPFFGSVIKPVNGVVKNIAGVVYTDFYRFRYQVRLICAEQVVQYVKHCVLSFLTAVIARIIEPEQPFQQSDKQTYHSNKHKQGYQLSPMF
jgi:hypothetical protein